MFFHQIASSLPGGTFVPQIARIPPPTKDVKQFDLSPKSTTLIATFLYVPIPTNSNNKFPPTVPLCPLVVVICFRLSPFAANCPSVVPCLFQRVANCPGLSQSVPNRPFLSPGAISFSARFP